MENLLGVVLCGGQSKRMGKDKGLLFKDGKSWAQIMAKKLKDTGLPVAISINETQQEKYQQIFPDTPLLVDHLPIDGPLDGLLSIHRNFPDKDILLMACDLIDMDKITIQTLVDTYSNKTGFEFYAYRESDISQTFCAIYTSKGLTKVYQKFEAYKLKKYSLHQLFEAGNTLYLPVTNEKSFRNYNSL